MDISTPVVVSSYETLRRVALEHSGPDGPSLGFTLLLRQGLTAWLRAWARYPRPVVPAPAAVSISTIPPLVHHDSAARAPRAGAGLGQMVLLLQQEGIWT